jgi:hypothetical protein
VTGSTGCLFVHACPASLRPAADHAIATALPPAGAVEWVPAEGGFSAIREWAGHPGTAAVVAASLRLLGAVVFEVTEDPAAGSDGERYSYVPGLGLFRAATNAVGDVVVDENQLTAAVRDAPNAEALRERLALLVGRPWDDALEPLRMRARPAERAVAAG